MSDDATIVEKVGRYYAGRLAEHGATARGVDWNSEQSQVVRFEQLERILTGAPHEHLVDVGCGYGAMLTHLRSIGWTGRYTGVDVAPEMVAAARERHGDDATFVTELPAGLRADAVVASGIFNVRLDVDDAAWEAYVLATLDTMHAVATRAIAFNMLTGYSDPERMRADLYYGDPGRWLDTCVRRYSRHVAVLHDYELYEFTLTVRRPAP